MPGIAVDIEKTGTILTGDYKGILRDGEREITDAVAEDAEQLIRAELRSVLRHPTGRYQSRSPQIQRTGDDKATVTDGQVVYGAWLEGVGSRNTRSRFKGYSTFRRMLQKAEGRVDDTAQPAVNRMIEELDR